mmetsp:Transcript_27517/g.65182  ORF Transcript_27517/g.65182 Transcript_27517/m.65182 type:complete len:392 (-) Transcript_27517:292-1467(-)
MEPEQNDTLQTKPKSWKFASKVAEAHKAPMYCISFNFIDPRQKDLFATVGKNQATVYRCKDDGDMEPIQVYLDDDESEEFFTCAWTINRETGSLILLLGGQKRFVRAVDLNEGNSVHTFIGHGNAINDIKVHPTQPELFLTASKDESLRLWNLQSKTCLIVFHGDGGHRNEVLSIDFHPREPEIFASCGMDNMVKIWSYKGLKSAVDESFHWNSRRGAFPTRFVHYPEFSSSKVHGNYVDCVRWLGDLILSKSVDNRILLWRVDLSQRQSKPNSLNNVQYLQEYNFSGADIWFIRFSLDYWYQFMAVGNRTGKVFVYDIFESTSCLQKLTAPGLKCPVRQTAVSFDGKTILCSCEDSSIYRWDAVRYQRDGDDRTMNSHESTEGSAEEDSD